MEQEKQHIGKLFDRIAGSYDSLNHLLSLNIDRLWRRRTVRTMQPAGDVLDVAIGTADLTIEILRQQKACHVTGLDLSRAMMRLGEEKVCRAGHAERVRFDYGSAQEMPYADASFDAVTCAYGVRNFSDRHAGLSEMCRVLRPGGQLRILEFSYPTNRLIRWAYDLYFSHILPAVGNMLSKDKDAYTYLNRSVKAFPQGETFCDQLRQAGFRDVRFTPMTFGITTLYTAAR